MEDAGQVTRDALKICSRDPKCPGTVAIQSKPPVHQLRLRSRLDRIVPLFSSTACFDRILTWQTDAVMTRVTNQRIRGPINKTTTNEKKKNKKNDDNMPSKQNGCVTHPTVILKEKKPTKM